MKKDGSHQAGGNKKDKQEFSKPTRPQNNRNKSGSSVFSVDHEYFSHSKSIPDVDAKFNDYSSELKEGDSSKVGVAGGDIGGDVLYDNFEDNDNIDDDDLIRKDSNDKYEQMVSVKFFDHNLNKSDSVYLIGSFNNWTEKLKLNFDVYKTDASTSIGFFEIKLLLPTGIYRVKFIVNNEVKYSDNLPIATDKSGNVVNWFEVDYLDVENSIFEAGSIENSQINNKRSASGFISNSSVSVNPNNNGNNPPPLLHFHSDPNYNNKHNKEKLTYTNEIPTQFEPKDDLVPEDEKFLKNHPMPELPVYLNNTYLNTHFSTHHTNNSDILVHSSSTAKSTRSSNFQGLNSHIIPHVNLNHLLTSNIKNEVLSVAITTRYSGKFMTQIMFAPASQEDVS